MSGASDPREEIDEEGGDQMARTISIRRLVVAGLLLIALAAAAPTAGVAANGGGGPGPAPIQTH